MGYWPVPHPVWCLLLPEYHAQVIGEACVTGWQDQEVGMKDTLLKCSQKPAWGDRNCVRSALSVWWPLT